MRTVVQTAVFDSYALGFWTDSDLDAFITFIATNPYAGVVIRGSGGCRKVRWSSTNKGKRAGARVIYYLSTDGVVWLLISYSKARYENLPAEFLRQLKRGIENG